MYYIFENSKQIARGKKSDVLKVWSGLKNKRNDVETVVNCGGYEYSLRSSKTEAIETFLVSTVDDLAEDFVEVFHGQVDAERKSAQGVIDKFEQDMDKARKDHSYTYVLNWSTENVVLAEATIHLCDAFLKAHATVGKHHDTWVKRFLALSEQVEKFIDNLTQGLCGAPWENRSTSPVANMVSDAGCTARAKMLRQIRGWYEWSKGFRNYAVIPSLTRDDLKKVI